MSENTRRALLKYHTGRKTPRDVVEKRAQKLRGRKVSKTCREKLSKIKKGVKQSEEQIQRVTDSINKLYSSGDSPYTKRVRCIETGVEYYSLGDAGRRTGISYKRISEVARGIRKTAGGYHWEYANPEQKDIKLGREIICVETGEKFDSIRAAARFAGVYNGNIKRTLDGHPDNTAGGYHWRYSESISSEVKPKEGRPVECIETGEVYCSISFAARCKGSTCSNITRAIKTGGRARGYHWRYMTDEPMV